MLAAAAGSLTTFWGLLNHKLLLYGDATAHMMIARRIVDSATPGLSQCGTVWLPLPHLLAAALIYLPGFWKTGLAGAVVSVAAFVLAARFLYSIVYRHFGKAPALWTAGVFVFNPNLLYIASTPMTEAIFLATFLGALDQISRLEVDGKRKHIVGAGLWALAGTLTRYDGWFLLPFYAAAIAALGMRRGVHPPMRRMRRTFQSTLIFAAIAGMGPLFWFAYNQYYFKDWLSFARGPYSARQIYLRALQHGGQPYPGDHNLWVAVFYYGGDILLNCGLPLLLLSAAGLVWWVAERRRRSGDGATWSVVLLMLPLPWYVWAMWSGNVPIFIPQLWPHGYYNVRYGLQMLPAIAVLSGFAAAKLLDYARARKLSPGRVGTVLALAVLASYLLMLRGSGPISYAEAVYNSPDRLLMQRQLARALAGYQHGDRVLMFLGTYPGALADDGIPIHEVIEESNYRRWDAALQQPHMFARWVVVEDQTITDARINHDDLQRYYKQVAMLHAPQQHNVRVYIRLATAGT